MLNIDFYNLNQSVTLPTGFATVPIEEAGFATVPIEEAGFATVPIPIFTEAGRRAEKRRASRLSRNFAEQTAQVLLGAEQLTLPLAARLAAPLPALAGCIGGSRVFFYRNTRNA